ncbi:MAG: hypothetical protein RR869_01210 [Lachnospiraceae bacterium]
MNHKKFPITHLGTSLILVVLIILALVTFSTLSVVNTNRDYQSEKKVADRTTAYYQASNQAEVILAQIDDALLASTRPSPEPYYEAAKTALQQISSLTTDFSAEVPTVSYTVPITEFHLLQVTLLLPYPQSDSDSYYQIQTWKEISTKEWKSNSKLKLIS